MIDASFSTATGKVTLDLDDFINLVGEVSEYRKVRELANNRPMVCVAAHFDGSKRLTCNHTAGHEGDHYDLRLDKAWR